jgi:hypothetical protein
LLAIAAEADCCATSPAVGICGSGPLGHCDLRVVVEDARGNSAKVCESLYMAFQESFRCLGRKRHHETIVRVWQVHRQVVCLLLHSGNHHQRFAEVRLRLARRMCQGE